MWRYYRTRYEAAYHIRKSTTLFLHLLNFFAFYLLFDLHDFAVYSFFHISSLVNARIISPIIILLRDIIKVISNFDLRIEFAVLKSSFDFVLVSTGATLLQYRFHLTNLAFRALLRILCPKINFGLLILATYCGLVVYKNISELPIILTVVDEIGVQVLLQLVLIKIITILVSFFLRRTILS